jgi:hypothetical protein
MRRGVRLGQARLSQARLVIRRVLGTGLALAAVLLIYIIVLTRGAIL